MKFCAYEIYIFGILTLGRISCSQPDNLPSETGNLVHLNLDENAKEYNYNNIIKDNFEIIPLESTEESVIGQIDKLIYADDKFFILDIRNAKSLFCFDNTGKMIFKIDALGQGPGEFVLPFDFDIDNFSNIVKILDVNQRKIISYNFNGEFLHEEPIDDQIKSFCILDTDHYAFHIDGRANLGNSIGELLWVYSKDSKSYKNKGVRDNGQTDYYPINSEYSRFGEKTLFIHAWTDTIYRISTASIEPLYIINFGKEKVTEEIKAMELLEMRNHYLSNNYRFHKGQICENSNFVSFQWVRGSKGSDDMAYACYYDKKNKRIINIPEYENWIGNITLIGPLTAYNEGFIGYFQPYAYDNLEKFSDRFNNNNFNWSEISETDNPILVKYSLDVN